MKFSQRYGFQPAPSILAPEAMPATLRNRLWTIISARLRAYTEADDFGVYRTGRLVYELWDRFYKEPADTLSSSPDAAIKLIRDRVIKHRWYEVYDLLEAIAGLDVRFYRRSSTFTTQVNRVLEEELAAWRFAGTQLQPITEEHELKSIEEAAANPISGVRLHIQAALTCMAQRPEPDTRNAIKEAISAVEAAAKSLTGNEQKGKATYLSLVQRLKEDGAHPQFVEAWKNFYNYTSDAGGVRHAAKDGDLVPTIDEAKLFVITASAFTNYLAARYACT